jgi:hypothetical protein
MNQRRGLKRVVRPLLTHLVVGEAPQLVVDNGQEGLDGFLIALTPVEEQFTNRFGRR